MKLLFNEEDHTYHSIDDIGIKWTSVTSVISKLKKPFDAKKVANKVSKNKKSKWYNLKPTDYNVQQVHGNGGALDGANRRIGSGRASGAEGSEEGVWEVVNES